MSLLNEYDPFFINDMNSKKVSYFSFIGLMIQDPGPTVDTEIQTCPTSVTQIWRVTWDSRRSQ